MADYNTPFDFQASQCSREIFDLRFLYFSPEEIRATSVHQIHSILTYDEFGEAVRGGLHAPLLGPAGNLRDIVKKDGGQRKLSVCETCGCQSDCPGHMGHIELAATVYNPLLMNQLYKVLKAMCLECHHLKAPGVRTAETVRIIHSMLPGKFSAADEKTAKDAENQKRSAWLAELDGDAVAGHIRWLEMSEENGTKEWVAPQKQATAASNTEFAEKLVAKFAAGRQEKQQQQTTQGPSVGRFPQDSASMQSIRGLLDEYVREFPHTKCHNCKSKPGKCVKDGHKGFHIRREGKKGPEVISAALVKKELELLWNNEREILNWLIPGAREIGPQVFFLEAILVPPVNFRPPSMPTAEGNMPRFSRQSTHLLAILEANEKVIEANKAVTGKEDGARGKLLQATQQLQLAVNQYMDGTKTEKHAKSRSDGVRQLLERKSGLFRMKMMGKRVNFSARSVISPDPNIETSEIGIPKFVAKKLTYPEVAAKHNAKLLRTLVERGPEYPGATEVHVPGKAGNKNVLALGKMPQDKRKALAKQLVTDIESGNPPMTVFRQLQDGDPLLVNRQPTLHKPGIMAHVARVLEQEKTVRLHYVNCNTYNADFDGDEMNLHAPQDPIGRIEALEIAQADCQYLVPTSGKPLRGLIQDHVIAGAMLTKRDTFFDRAIVCELLYTGLRAAAEKGQMCLSGGNNRTGKANIVRHFQRVALQLDPPTLFKPRKLWTGKQVFSMLVKNITRIYGAEARSRAKGKPSSAAGLNMESKSKTPGDLWNGKLDGDKEESSILFRDADLIRGVLDKSQFGATSFGITHLLFELFGPHVVGLFLAALARLLTLYLQIRGFTCAFADLVLRDDAEQHRHQLLLHSRSVAKTVGEKWLQSQVSEIERGTSLGLKSLMFRLSDQPEYALKAKIEGSVRSQSHSAYGLLDQSMSAEAFEGMMIGSMKESWTDMIGRCIPGGQQMPFPKNCFAAMVQTGAKGSKINHSQICCCLGQQELEGRLPPLMATMRSLPCFAPYDLSSRTRGYISDRFLTGIRPQEFFFHCMAGREGLVDTAVKTSRSGYLQRCLVKHLESLKVSYDMSVRDNDGAVVQFLYGEDGIDVMRSPYLLHFSELQQNFHFVQSTSQRQLEQLKARQMDHVDMDAAGMYSDAQQKAKAGRFKAAGKQLRNLLATCPRLEPAAVEYIQAARRRLKQEAERVRGHSEGRACQQMLDPTASVLSPARFFGSTSEAHEEALRKFVEEAEMTGTMSPEQVGEFRECMQLKFLRSLAEPGEAVGVVAAQSMGEPSTQMTLNTFHLAGHGGANVTLGIPRLREIIQTGSKSCATPLMRVPVIADDKGQTDYQARLKYAKHIQQRFRSLKLQDAINRLVIHEGARLSDGRVVYYYEFLFEFAPIDKMVQKRPNLTAEKIEAIMKGLCRRLQSYIKKIKDTQTSFTNETDTGTNEVEAAGQGAANAEEDAGEGAGRPAAEEGGTQSGLALAEEGGGSSKKKGRKILGAEDKFAAEDEADAEMDAGSEVEGSEKSGGMYSSEEDDQSQQGVAEEPPEPGTGGDNPGPPSGGGLGEPPSKKARTKEHGKKEHDDEDDEGEDENEMGEAEWLSDGPHFQGNLQKMEVDENGKPPNTKTNPAETAEKKPKRVLPKAKAAKEAPGNSHSKLLDEILASGETVYRSKLENNSMMIFVHHSHLQIPHKIFLTEVVVDLVKNTDLQDPATDGVKRVHVREDPGQDKVVIECEGINLFGLQCQKESTLDVDRIYTNDILKTLRMYGVEAARAAVVREVQEVFGHYGIVVDTRHLSLVADYMTQSGELRAFNRMGMTHNASPLLQMSFETATSFLVATCKDAVVDRMSSPASALVVGKTPPVGTGTVSLLTSLRPPEPQWKRRREIKLRD